MDVNSVLSHLAHKDLSFPVMKLAWSCQLELGDIPKIPPSHYIRELGLNTLERHSLLCHQQKKLEFWGPGLLFSVVPSIVVFQQYKAGESQCVTVCIRNISKQTQKVHLRMEDTNQFQLESNSSLRAKFASGMTISATIRFTPQDDGDYVHKFVVETRESSFAIPILAIGHRAVLEIPDKISFGEMAVKDLVHWNQSVCNSGSKHANFTLSADGPFSVSPEKCSLAPRDSFSIQLTCYSESVGGLEGFICIQFDNGEQIYTALSADSVEEDVSMSEARLRFPPTYIGLRSSARLTITNNSGRPLQFSWKKNGVRQERRESGAGGDSTVSILKALRRSIADQAALHPADVRTSLVPEELRHVELSYLHPEPLFHHKQIVIEPMTGLVQPHSTHDIQLLFSPAESTEYEAVAWLDIAGKEERLPLHVCGQGVGPKFQFGFASLDVGEVYLGGRHCYEIPVTNTTEIKGNVHFETVAGLAPSLVIRVKPKSLKLAPEQYSAFYASFTSAGPIGPFVEELKFRAGAGPAAATGETYSVLIRGRLAFPQLSFTKPVLEFGEVAYGFPKTEQIILHNDTMNQVNIRLRMDVDGIQPPLSCRELLDSLRLDECDGEEEEAPSPKEFSIKPSTFQMEPKGFQVISVTLLPNTYRRFERSLLVFIPHADGGGDPVHSLRVSANSVVPALKDVNPDNHLGSVFADFASSGEFQIANESSAAGIYRLDVLPSENGVLEPAHLVGLLRARSVTSIPYKITCPKIGEASASAELYLVGLPEKVLDLRVSAHSSPCRLEASVKQLDFGTIAVAELAERSFELMNESPLAVSFRTHFLQPSNSNFGADCVVLPESSIVEAFGRAIIQVGVKLAEAGAQSEIIRIQTTEPSAAAHVEVRVKVVGSGTSLEVVKADDGNTVDDISVIDFGVMFAKTTRTLSYSIKNPGHFLRTLEWKPAKAAAPENAKTSRKAARVVESELAKYVREKKETEAKKKATKVPKSNFQIAPTTTTLASQESTTFNFKVSCNQPASLQEEFVLWVYAPYTQEDRIRSSPYRTAAVGRGGTAAGAASQNPKELAHKPVIALCTTLKATFELARLAVSDRLLSFQVGGNPAEDHRKEEKVTLRISNPGQLPLPAMLRTEFPFSIILPFPEPEPRRRRGQPFDSYGDGSYEEGLFPEDEYGYPNHLAASEPETRLVHYAHTIPPSSTLSLTLHFDGRSVKTDQKSLAFSSKLSISVDGHPFTDSVQLDGTARFPHVECDQAAPGEGVDFGSVPFRVAAVEKIKLKNTCDYPVDYRWFVRPRTTWIRHGTGKPAAAVEQEGEAPAGEDVVKQSPTPNTPPTTPAPPGEQEQEQDLIAAALVNPHCSELDKQDCERGESAEEEEDGFGRNPTPSSLQVEFSSEEQLGEGADAQQPPASIVQEPPSDKQEDSLLVFTDEEDEFIDFSDSENSSHPRHSMTHLNALEASIQFTRDALDWKRCTQEFKANPPLPVSLEEAYPSRPPIVPDLLTITPLYGAIEAGEEQEFSIQFCGGSELQFKTTLTCSLEGGAYMDLMVTGCSVLPTEEMLCPRPKMGKIGEELEEKPTDFEQEQGQGAEEQNPTKSTSKIPRPVAWKRNGAPRRSTWASVRFK